MFALFDTQAGQPSRAALRSLAAAFILALLANGALAAGAPAVPVSAHASASAAAQNGPPFPQNALADLPLKRDAQDSGAPGLGAVLLALAVLAVCVPLALALRRRLANAQTAAAAPAPSGVWTKLFGRHSGGAIEVVGSTALAPQLRLHAVRWQGTDYLIAATAGTVTVLDRHSVAVGTATHEQQAGAA